MATENTFTLERFIDAQAPVYPQVLTELRSGRKSTHWMWFIFPQHRDLGRSAMAKHYGIASVEEARAYLAHPLLGSRLEACTRIVLGLQDTTAHDIFGSPDDLKFRSCMTLFCRAAGGGESVFAAALGQYFDGAPDPATLALVT